MLKINQKIKNTANSLLNNLLLILIILINNTNMLYAANINWIEVSKTPVGIQYLDRDSIELKGKRIIELTTKYIKIDN